ncbi:hypothetical protein CCACVL1_14595 [Corchorus capsularis]|uniref:HMA domain-containing protein n=1 Tax=Corchorus capsularis TaxID=210143 RepID=A0A1R3I6F9_COCAP|nr:hypothetical protein CCACVL1_14595 [Corchorus capsularis]
MEGQSEKKAVLKMDFYNEKQKQKVMKEVSGVPGIRSIVMDMEESKLILIGCFDVFRLLYKLNKECGNCAELVLALPYNAQEEEEKKKAEAAAEEQRKKDARNGIMVLKHRVFNFHHNSLFSLFCCVKNYGKSLESNHSVGFVRFVVEIATTETTTMEGQGEKKAVLKMDFYNEKQKQRVMKEVSGVPEIRSIIMDMEESKLILIGCFDVFRLLYKLNKECGNCADLGWP